MLALDIETSMVKNDFSAGCLHVLCDKCRKILATDHNFSTDPISWETVSRPWKGRVGHTRRMDFCDEKCKIVFLRGRKYWRRKQEHIQRNIFEMALGTHGK